MTMKEVKKNDYIMVYDIKGCRYMYIGIVNRVTHTFTSLARLKSGKLIHDLYTKKYELFPRDTIYKLTTIEVMLYIEFN